MNIVWSSTKRLVKEKLFIFLYEKFTKFEAQHKLEYDYVLIYSDSSNFFYTLLCKVSDAAAAAELLLLYFSISFVLLFLSTLIPHTTFSFISSWMLELPHSSLTSSLSMPCSSTWNLFLKKKYEIIIKKSISNIFSLVWCCVWWWWCVDD